MAFYSQYLQPPCLSLSALFLFGYSRDSICLWILAVDILSWRSINHLSMQITIPQAFYSCHAGAGWCTLQFTQGSVCLICVLLGWHAVFGQAAGHSLLCVNSLHKPVPGQRCAPVWLYRRRTSQDEGGRAHSSVQEHAESVMGLSTYVSWNTHCGPEVSLWDEQPKKLLNGCMA